MGGVSKEREISLRTGTAISGAMERKGYKVLRLDVKDENFIKTLLTTKVDAAFLALHGRYGEDGTIQGLLEWFKIPYTGSSVKASAICFDKVATKVFLSHAGMVTPAYRVFNQGEDLKSFVANFDLHFPVIVKPNSEGSTIGISRVFEKGELEGALNEALQYDKVILVEQYIQGREVTVGVLEGQALPVIEVRPKGGFYDFASKYTKGATEYLVPAPLDVALTQKLQRLGEKAFQSLECQGAVRADFMINSNNEPYFLEVNTIPGMTETSLLPKAAQALGISFEDLCETILKGAALKS
ncbi:MAG: hypothetical protein ACD_73C00614G0001 [uncultured bacterium]|nr:MAG: hypothetical protein ACD_73C00614G0001 [uncultured bacterium]